MFSLFPRQRARVPNTDKEVYCGVHSLPRSLWPTKGFMFKMFSFQLSQTMILSSKCSLSLKYPAPECSKQNNIFTEHIF